VVDASEDWTDEDSNLLGKVRPLGALLVACNKADLPPKITNADLDKFLKADGGLGWPPEVAEGGLEPPAGAQSPPPPAVAPALVVWTSALTGEGIPELKEKILEIAAPVHDLGTEGEFITNLRHQQLLKDSLLALARARQAAEQNLPHEMLLLDLYEALRPLDQITGATYVDDVLDIIFSTFCVGK
jgi:tRNA U34 5-carboxymethylaminomethyl modifying GTPase MnmE/TrmE